MCEISAPSRRALAAALIWIAAVAGDTSARERQAQSQLKVVRAYEPWADHDPARAERTAATLASYDAECTSRTGPFELLRMTTSREKGAAVAREIGAGVPAAIERAYERAASALPGPSLTVCIYAGELSRGLPFLDGVGGVALGGGVVKLILHPTEHRFGKVPYTIAHEYHHEALRLAAPWGSPDDVPIREGKADHFAVGLYPELRPPHTNRLSAEEFGRVWPAFLEFRKGGTPQADFMISSQGPLPIWAGYRLGYEMVEHYIAATGADYKRLLRVSSAEIIEAFARSSRVNRWQQR